MNNQDRRKVATMTEEPTPANAKGISRRAFGAAAALGGLAAGAGLGFSQSAAAATSAGATPTPASAQQGAAPSPWALHNYDFANTRNVTQTPIGSNNVAELTVKWQFPLPAGGFFGAFASNPLVVGGVVYLIDLNSTVYALDVEKGSLLWQKSFNSANLGPNGVAWGNGRLFGTTSTGVFALNAKTGATVWSVELIRDGLGGLEVAPLIYGDTVVVSTAPPTTQGYIPRAMGVIYALDAATGATRWSFNTVKDGDLWGNAAVNSGGGMWYPPSLDANGRLYLGTGNPAPYPGTTALPNGGSRPGPNLYTSSLVSLDGTSGELLWYQQITPHDLRDYDFQASPILTTVPVNGVTTPIVIGAGKSGIVAAFRAADGQPLWSLPVGKHQNDLGPLPDTTVVVYPGTFGGVETPMALSNGVLFVPWVDAASEMSSTSLVNFGVPNLPEGRGGLAAVNAATGQVLWQNALPQMALGAATVANDVVFTSTLVGDIFAFDVATGATLWSATAPNGINSFPAIYADTLLVGAAANVPWAIPNPKSALVAYSLK
jgi:alcohol dehydrogenase (cytochrome c)